MKKPFFASFLFLALALQVSAHTGGFTYEVAQGDYFVDVGSNKLQFIPNELALFEFNIYHKSDQNNLADFESVYVTISDNVGVIYSGFVHRPEGMLTTMSYSFSKPGEYIMSARFQTATQTLTEVTFPLQVMGSQFNAKYLVALFATGGIGLALGWWLGHRKTSAPAI